MVSKIGDINMNVKQYAYACSNCSFIMIYTSEQNKDVNCPMCTNKSAINEKTKVELDVTVVDVV